MVNEKALIGISATKSKDRVRDQGEVFTASEQVTAMLDLVRDCSDNIDAKFLEPSCGNGNFLVAILNRKLAVVTTRFKKQQDFEFYSLVALASIYGVDICVDNVKEAKERMRVILKDWYSYKHNTHKPSTGFYDAVDYIMDQNIICGDMLNGTSIINFTEFTSPKLYKFKERVYRLSDLLGGDGLFARNGKAKPVHERSMKSYLELGNV